MLLHLIGAAVVFVGLLKGLKRYIGGVEKVRMLCGVPLSRRDLPNSGSLLPREQNGSSAARFSFSFSIFLTSI